MAVSDDQPISAENLAAALGSALGISTLWQGNAGQAQVDGVADYDLVLVGIGSESDERAGVTILLVPGVIDGATVKNGYGDNVTAAIDGSTVRVLDSGGVSKMRVVIGIRSGGGQLLADLLARVGEAA